MKNPPGLWRGGRQEVGGWRVDVEGGLGWWGGFAEECSTKSAFHWSGKPRLLPLPPCSLLAALSHFAFFWFNIKNVPNDWAETPRGFQWVCARMCECACVCGKCHTKGQVSMVAAVRRTQRWKQTISEPSLRNMVVLNFSSNDQWEHPELVSVSYNQNNIINAPISLKLKRTILYSYVLATNGFVFMEIKNRSQIYSPKTAGHNNNHITG